MENTKQFTDWLKKKLNVKSDQEFKSALQKMGDKGIQDNYKQFQKENSMDNEETQEMKEGGKLSYLKCLQEYKKGGKMKSCGCGSKMKKPSKVQKAQFGAILGAAKSAFGAAKTLGSTLGSIGKIGNAIGQVSSMLQPKTNNVRMMGTQTVSTVNPAQVPGGVVTTAQTTPKLNTRSIPNVKMEDGGELEDPKLAKLKALKAKNKKVAK